MSLGLSRVGLRRARAPVAVVAVATEVRDTKTIEMLDQLKEKYPDIRIELWDQQEISSRLSTEPDLVSRFFGPATAAAFCTAAPPPTPAAPPPSIAADA